jgi:CrcB protein
MLKNPALRAPFAISLGAIAGALCRYYIGAWFAQLFGTAIPYGTLLINISGCFVMGFFATLSLERAIAIHPDVRLLVTTGFLGSYTTFSTYALDMARLLEHSWESNLLYCSGSVALGLLALQLGIALAKVARTQRHNGSE